MEKKILLAVDDSAHSKNAVRYAVKMSLFVKELSYTLFNVQPDMSSFLADEAKTNLRAQSALEKLKKKNAEKSQLMLERHRALMTELGIDSKRIELKTQPKKIGTAKDIIESAQEKRYDAIVVGRRGLSRMQEVLMGSLTTKLLEHSRIIPVWVVDGDVISQKIMAAIDGSETSFRAIDHLSFMLGGNPNVTITLFHVIPKAGDYCELDLDDKDIEEMILSGNKTCIAHFNALAYKKFKDAGISEKQIQIKEVPCTMKVGKIIIDEMKNGDYGTVVIGRRGINKAFFMGSVSQYVLERTSDSALWLVS